MLDVDQILSNVDLGEEAPPAEKSSEDAVDSTAAAKAAEETTDEGQVSESADESQGTEQTQEEAPPAPAKGIDKTKDTVPLAKALGWKHEARDAKMRLAEREARDAIAASAAKAAPPVPDKSPMEVFMEKEGDDATPTAKVLVEQERWRQAHQERQAVTQSSDTVTQSIAVAVQTMTDEAMGEGLGLHSVWLVGNTFLTEGDKLDVRNAGDKAGELLYQRCLERAFRSGSPQGKVLAAAWKQVRDAKSVAPSGKKVVTTKKTEEAPTREQVLQPDGFGSEESLDEFFGV